MSREMVFTVGPDGMKDAVSVSFAEAGLRERDDLQEWVLSRPEILGADLKVVSSEFDRWEAAGGIPAYDRLDVLALDRSGRLVVAELKRDRAPDTVTMQALNYAAMVSRFSVDTLADVYARYRSADALDTEQALTELREWAPEISDETLAPPGVVLVASDFGPQITNTALYLYENGIDVRLIQARLYRTLSGQLMLTTSQLLPVPEAESFMVRPRSTPAGQTASRTARARRASVPDRLIAHKVFHDNEQLQIVVPGNVGEDRLAIERWLAEDEQRSTVFWRNDGRDPVRWAQDDKPYNLTTLIRKIIERATDESPRTQVWGPNWYRTADGQALYKIAEELGDA